MSQLTKQDLLRAWTPKIERVDLPELGEGSFVFVKQFSAADRGKLEILGSKFKDGKSYNDIPKVRFLTIALTACEENGKLIFSEAELDSIGQMSAAAVDKIFEAAANLNGLSKKAVEDAEKN